MASFRISLLLLACYAQQIDAFGSCLEPLSRAYSSAHRGDRYASRLYDHDSDESSSPRTQTSEYDFVTSEFNFVPALFGGLDDFSSLFNGGFDGTFPVLQEQADALAFETFGENSSLEVWDSCGEECKECDIPKAWNTPGEAIDVMEFLGVTRVKPLC